MQSAPEQILKPETPEEAASLLDKLGDDVGLLWMGARVEPPETWAKASMIDLSDLPLNYIEVTPEGVAIGATTPVQRLVEDETLEAVYDGLIPTAARRLAHYGIRNLANVGGAVTARTGPPELSLALMVLGCQASMVGTQAQVFPLQELWSGEGGGGRGLLKELRLPAEPDAGGGWALEWLARSPMDQALVAAAAAVTVADGKIAAAHMAVAGVGWLPGLIARAEEMLSGVSVTGWAPDDLIQTVKDEVSPEADFRASAGYQTDMMARLAGRAVAAAVEKAGAR